MWSWGRVAHSSRPLRRLGLIVLDEEHEPSYKQDAEQWGSYKVFYDARTTARKLAELTGSVLIFGTATPSLESYYLAERASPHLAAHAADGYWATVTEAGTAYMEMPPVEVVDMRQELRAGNRSVLSRSLQAELLATLDANEQAILFLNRRGTSTFVLCRDCGAVAKCTRCDAPLTYHERAAALICHHCNRRYPIPDCVPRCGSKRIKYFGAGTQRIEGDDSANWRRAPACCAGMPTRLRARAATSASWSGSPATRRMCWSARR